MNSKKLIMIPILVFVSSMLSSVVYAYEASASALQFPGTLSAPSLEVHLEHRFLTSVTEKPLDNAFGLTNGISADVGLRYVIWNHLQSVVSYQSYDKNLSLGLGYSYAIVKSLVNSSIGFDVYTYTNYNNQTTPIATFSYVTTSGGPFFERITPVVNIGFDSDNRHAGLGFGFNASVLEFMDVSGEYFPVLARDSVHQDAVNTFALGLIFKTVRHQFSFFVSNNNDCGMRKSMMGAINDDVHIGFRINRWFDFY